MRRDKTTEKAKLEIASMSRQIGGNFSFSRERCERLSRGYWKRKLTAGKLKVSTTLSLSGVTYRIVGYARGCFT